MNNKETSGLISRKYVSEQAIQIKNFLESGAFSLEGGRFFSSFHTIHSNVRQMIIKYLSADYICEPNQNFGGMLRKTFIHRYEVTVRGQLKEVWKKLQLPVLDYFSDWGNTFRSNSSSEKVHLRRSVERRKMLTKLRRVFRDIHRFHYGILEHVVFNFDTSPIIAPYIINELNLASYGTNGFPKTQFGVDDPVAIDIVSIFYDCLLYLGYLHYQMVLLENKRLRVRDNLFTKAIRYLQIAVHLLPSRASAYYRLATIERKLGNRRTCIYYLVRSMTARISSERSKREAFCLLKQLVSDFSNYIPGLDVGDREQSTADGLYYQHFPEILYAHLTGAAFLEDTPSKMEAACQLKKMMFKDLECVLKTVKSDIILYDVVILIGFFHIHFSHEQKHGMDLRLEALKPIHLKYLEFVSDYFAVILACASRELNTGISSGLRFLGVIRVFGSWIKSNKCILQFFHRDRNFCNALAQLLDLIIRCHGSNNVSFLLHKPKRGYFFREDVILRDFSCIGYSITDFDDSEILTKQNSLNRLLGFPPSTEKLKEVAETELKLHAIACFSIKFLKGNSCGISLEFGEDTCIRVCGMVSNFRSVET